MTEPLDLEAIEARYADVPRSRREHDPQVIEALALIAEVRRLRGVVERLNQMNPGPW